MQTYEEMQKIINKLLADFNREVAYTRKVNDRYEHIRQQLKDSISKSEHERIVAELRQDYERKLSEILTTQPRVHNPHGAGRKRIATKEIAARVLELNGQGLSQSKIAVKVADEFNIKIKRTTVGEIVRGNYTPTEAE